MSTKPISPKVQRQLVEFGQRNGLGDIARRIVGDMVVRRAQEVRDRNKHQKGTHEKAN